MIYLLHSCFVVVGEFCAKPQPVVGSWQDTCLLHTTSRAEYEGWEGIPTSAQQKIREAHFAREAAEAKLLHAQR